MTTIKKLRKEALKLIKDSLNIIDGRSLTKFYDIANTARGEKLKGMVETLKALKAPNLAPQGLDDNINIITVPTQPKNKKTVSLKDIVYKKRPLQYKSVQMVEVDVRANISYDVINGNRKNGRSFKFKDAQQVNITVTVPRSQMNNKEALKNAVYNSRDVESQVTEVIADSLKFVKINDIDILSSPVDKSTMFSSNVDMKSIKMYDAEFVNLDINGLTDYKFKPFQCVYGALQYKYGYKPEDILKVFQAYEDSINLNSILPERMTLTSGVSTNMLLHLAKVKDFSMYALDINKKLFAKHIRKNHNNSPLVYVLHNEHCYLINDPSTILSIKNTNQTRNEAQKQLVSDLFRDYDVVNTFETMPILEDIPVIDYPKYTKTNIIYATHDLYPILMELYKTFNEQITTKNIRVNSKKQVIYFYFKKFDLHIYADVNYDVETGTNYKDVKALCDQLKIKFNNQTISSIVLECEKKFYKLKSERIELTKEEKTEMLEENEHKCNKCEQTLKKNKYHFDHIIPLASGGSNDIDNIQILCIECHHNKTREEQQNSDYIFVNKSESSFNQEVKDIFISNDSKAYAFIENVQYDTKQVDEQGYDKLLHIDICKTRRNILMYNTIPLSTYTVMDQIEEFDKNKDINIKPGIYYIITSCYFPCRGNGWYSHNMISHLLETNRITLDDIKYKLLSTLNLEADYFKGFFNYVVNNFGDKFGKLGPNAMVGLFNKRMTLKSRLYMTSSEKQAISQFYESPNKNVLYDSDVDLYCIYENQEVEYDETRTPIYKYVVEQEAIELDLLKSRVEQAGGIIVRYNTDCISAYFKDDRKIKHIVNNTFWDEEQTVKKYKFEEKDTFVTKNEKMKQYKRTNVYEHNFNREWNITLDNDNFDELAQNIINSNQGILINGRAGCGKSTLLKNVMSKLPEDSFITLAPTNKACRVIDGQTIHKFLASSFNNKKVLKTKLEGKTYIIVDEISMVKELFYKVFLSIKRIKPDIKFILCGDFKQLKPVNDRYDYDYENSPALFELCDSNKLQLTKCRRADDIMFNLCNPSKINKLDISQFGNSFTTRHLAYTNNKRIEINEQCMKMFIDEQNELAKKNKKKKPRTLNLKKLEFDNNSQDVELLPNMPIIARVNNKSLEIANNETFMIISIDENIIKVKSDSTKQTINIAVAEFQKLFYVAFCITVHKSQGATFNYPYSIHQWNLFDRRLKYVALSRATRKEYINIIV